MDWKETVQDYIAKLDENQKEVVYNALVLLKKEQQSNFKGVAQIVIASRLNSFIDVLTQNNEEEM